MSQILMFGTICARIVGVITIISMCGVAEKVGKEIFDNGNHM